MKTTFKLLFCICGNPKNEYKIIERIDGNNEIRYIPQHKWNGKWRDYFTKIYIRNNDIFKSLTGAEKVLKEYIIKNNKEKVISEKVVKQL